MDPEMKLLLERGVLALERIAAALHDPDPNHTASVLQQIADALYTEEGCPSRSPTLGLIAKRLP